MKDGKKHLASKKLGDAEELLSEMKYFFRIHKSHIINVKFIDKYIRDTGEIIMQDGTSLALARSKKEEFLNLFGMI
jgi:two-component system LytT family response regulator